MSAANPDVIVVGGGIAGIAAAVRLAQHNLRVTLLETRTKLGGRATSFDDVRTGETIDNCQHVALGCCTNFPDLLERLGSREHIDWQRTVHWYEPGGRVSAMTPSRLLPAPGHLSMSFLSAHFLTFGEKAAIARAMLAILGADRAALDDEPFEQWLARAHQPAGAIAKFWEPVIVSACNLMPAQCSAIAAIHVFQEGFLAHRDAAVMGVPRVPLRDLYTGAVERIEQTGGCVRLRTGVRRVARDHIETARGDTLHAHRVILAAPFERVNTLVDQRERDADPRLAPLASLTHSPILGVHLVFDRPVLPTPNAVLVTRDTQWLFRKAIPGVPDGAAVHAVISAADDWLEQDEATVTQRVLDDIHACLPDSGAASLRSARPVMEKRATWAPVPGVERHRPTTTHPADDRGIILAGSYVRTGWPCTMEGATRSGEMAAAAALGKPMHAFIQPPLMPAMLSRILGGPSLRAQARQAVTPAAAPT